MAAFFQDKIKKNTSFSQEPPNLSRHKNATVGTDTISTGSFKIRSSQLSQKCMCGKRTTSVSNACLMDLLLSYDCPLGRGNHGAILTTQLTPTACSYT